MRNTERNTERGCGKYVELIMRHLDGLLPPQQSAELKTHLAGCAVCRAELLLQTRMRDALTEEIHPRLSIDFTSLVTRRAQETARPARRRSLWLGLVPAFGLMTVTVLLFTLQNGFRDALVRALGPSGGALASAAGRVGRVFSQTLPHAGGAPGLDFSGVAEPLMISLLLLLCVLPVVWCFRSVGEFLRQ
jgi:anti-sigma factor RsiW